LVDHIKEEVMGGGTCEREEEFGGGSLKERDHLEDTDVNGRGALKWDLNETA
jgi:hypothetical protein